MNLRALIQNPDVVVKPKNPLVATVWRNRAAFKIIDNQAALLPEIRAARKQEEENNDGNA